MSLSDTINKSCQDPEKPPQRPQTTYRHERSHATRIARPLVSLAAVLLVAASAPASAAILLGTSARITMLC